MSRLFSVHVGKYWFEFLWVFTCIDIIQIKFVFSHLLSITSGVMPLITLFRPEGYFPFIMQLLCSSADTASDKLNFCGSNTIGSLYVWEHEFLVRPRHFISVLENVIEILLFAYFLFSYCSQLYGKLIERNAT